MTATAKYLLWSAGVLLAALTSLALLGSFGPGCRVIGPVGAVDSTGIEKRLVPTSVEAYQYWKKRGFKGRTVLFVAQNWVRLDPNEVQMEPPMSRPYPLELYKIADLLERRRLNERNFLFVAASNGIARRIVALLPEKEFAELKEAALTSKTSKVSATEVYQTHQGFPRWYTTGAGFRGEREPVLLYVSASYFREAEPEVLFQQLVAAHLTCDSIVLSRGADPAGSPREQERLDRFARLVGLPVSAAVGPAAAANLTAPGAP